MLGVILYMITAGNKSGGINLKYLLTFTGLLNFGIAVMCFANINRVLALEGLNVSFADVLSSVNNTDPVWINNLFS